MMLDDLGLAPALQFLAEGVSKRRRLSIEVESSFDRRLAPAIEMVLYRVARRLLLILQGIRALAARRSNCKRGADKCIALFRMTVLALT